MATKKQIPDSDASEDLETENVHTPEPGDEEEKKDASPPQSTLSHRFRESPQKRSEDRKREKNSDDSIAVMVPAPERPWEYQPYHGDTTVDSVIELKVMDDREWYTIDYEDGKRELVSVLSYHFPAEVLPVWPCVMFVAPPVSLFLAMSFDEVVSGGFGSGAAYLLSLRRRTAKAGHWGLNSGNCQSHTPGSHCVLVEDAKAEQHSQRHKG
jgi:hypothetical protein